MTVKSGQLCEDTFVCLDATGALATPSVGPVGELQVNGVANAAAVTITGAAGKYKWSVTLPTLAAGDLVSLYVTATIATIATAGVVWQETADTRHVSDLNDLAAGAAMALTSGERTTLTAVIWNALVSGLTTVGSIGKRIVDYLDAAISSRATPAQLSISISATQAAALASGSLAIRFDYAMSQSISSTSTVDLEEAGSKLYFAIKNKETDEDSEALVYIEKATGLVYLAQAAAADASKGSLTLSGSSGAWSILVWLDETVTGALRSWKGSRHYELKHLPASGDPTLISTGKAVLSYGIVRATS